MAIKKSIITSSHAPANYHRIPVIRINWKIRALQGAVASFYTKEARDQNAGALQSVEFVVQGKDFPFEQEHYDQLHKLMNLGANQEISSIQMTFDGAFVNCTASVEMEIAGKSINNDIQFQVPKSAMPFDVLAASYAMVTKDEPNNPFAGGEQV